MTHTRSLRIHSSHGVVERANMLPDYIAQAPSRTIADSVPVAAIMSRDVVCAYPDLAVDKLLEVMIGQRLGCMPIVDDRGCPVGMVTKLDVVEQLALPSTRVNPVVADVMLPLAITLEEHATVAHAASMMAAEDLHHVMITSERRLIGVVSTMDITRWLASNDGLPS